MRFESGGGTVPVSLSFSVEHEMNVFGSPAIIKDRFGNPTVRDVVPWGVGEGEETEIGGGGGETPKKNNTR